MMQFPIPYVRPTADTPPPAMVRVVSREDVQWNRPVFKAPPLAVSTPIIDAALLATEIVGGVRGAR